MRRRFDPDAINQSELIKRLIRDAEEYKVKLSLRERIRRRARERAAKVAVEKRAPFVLPPGWSIEEVTRVGGTHIDRYFYEDKSGLKLRSTVEVAACNAIMLKFNCSAHASAKRYRALRSQGIAGPQIAAYVLESGGGDDKARDDDEKLQKAKIEEHAKYKLRQQEEERKARKEAALIKPVVKVSATYWGLKYTEEVWAACLAVLLTLPKEILMLPVVDVGALLDMYLLLAFVQGKSAGELPLLSAVHALLKRWKRVGVGLNEYLGGPVKGLENIGRKRWAVLKVRSKWQEERSDDASRPATTIRAYMYLRTYELIDCYRRHLASLRTPPVSVSAADPPTFSNIMNISLDEYFSRRRPSSSPRRYLTKRKC